MSNEGTLDNCKQWVIRIKDENNIADIWPAKQVIEKLSLQGSQGCDCMGHYLSCSWIVIEKKPAGHISTAISQFEKTIDAARRKGFTVKYALLIYSGKWGRTKQIYGIRKNQDSPTGYVLWYIPSTKAKAVVCKGITVWAIDIKNLEEYKKNVIRKIEYYE
ncbi:MAG: hypothetical protein QXJ93_01300 [Candidatus Rehaiarchaeum fermentans]|nr:hypothetical protein [Candidatus Rehaiarchaeum fermentans]